MKAPKLKSTLKKVSTLNTDQVKPLIQKLVTAYETRNFSIMSFQDFDQLVVQGHLHPETAVRLVGGCNHVS